MKFTKLSIAAILAAGMGTSAFAASDLAGAFKEGKVSGQIRAMYISTDYSKGVNDPKIGNVNGHEDTSAFALGGKLAYETAPLYGISAGAAFYTSQDMGTKDSNLAKVDSSTLDENDKSYSVLGQAYLVGQFGKTTVKIGRQQLDTPLAGSDDIRMIPNLFEAAVVINSDIKDTTLVAAHVTRMMGLDSFSDKSSRTQFQSMSRAALSDIVDMKNLGGTNFSAIEDRGVTAGAVVYSGVKDLTLQLWDYYAWEVLNAVYAQADYKLGFGKDYALNLAAQYEHLADMGKTKDALRSIDAKLGYDVYGFKASLETPIGLTPYLAYNKVSEQKNGTGIFVFGAWGGYAEFAMADETWYNSFNESAGFSAAAASTAMNGAQVWKAGADYSLAKIGLGNRTVGLSYTNYNLKDQYNGDQNTDTGVWDVKYTCNGALVKNLDATLLYEQADSKNDNLDNKKLKVVFNYNF